MGHIRARAPRQTVPAHRRRPQAARGRDGDLAPFLGRCLENPAAMKRSLRSWLWRIPIEQEIDEELDLHVEMRTREYIQRGMDPKTARDLALRRMGDAAMLKRTMAGVARKRDREMRLTLRLEELRDDLKFAFRQLRHS